MTFWWFRLLVLRRCHCILCSAYLYVNTKYASTLRFIITGVLAENYSHCSSLSLAFWLKTTHTAIHYHWRFGWKLLTISEMSDKNQVQIFSEGTFLIIIACFYIALFSALEQIHSASSVFGVCVCVWHACVCLCACMCTCACVLGFHWTTRSLTCVCDLFACVYTCWTSD